MLLFPVAYSLVSSISHIKFLSRIIILVSVLIGCYGLGQQFLKFPVISTSNSEFSKGLALSLGPGARINSTFAGHYDLAAFSLLPVLLLFGLIITQPKHRIFYVLCGVPVYWAMILSASRVTYAAFLIVSSGLILINRKIFWFVPLICIALVSFIISPQLAGRYRELIINHLKFTLLPSAYAAVDEDLPDALQPPPVPEDRSLNIRLQAEWPRAIRAWLKNPLLGSGLSSTGLATDNDYLRLLAETGFLGLISFAAVITRIYKHIYQYFLSPPQDFRQLFIVTCGLYLFGILLNALFIDVFEASKIAIITWLVLGVASKATKINSNVIN
jgi:O-antigen ligase